MYMYALPNAHTHAGMRRKLLLFFLKLVLIQTFKLKQVCPRLQQQYTRSVLILWSSWPVIQRLIYVYQYVDKMRFIDPPLLVWCMYMSNLLHVRVYDARLGRI